MPWSPAQHRLFELAAHNPQAATRVGIPQAIAQKMASEGIQSKARQFGMAISNSRVGAR